MPKMAGNFRLVANGFVGKEALRPKGRWKYQLPHTGIDRVVQAASSLTIARQAPRRDGSAGGAPGAMLASILITAPAAIYLGQISARSTRDPVPVFAAEVGCLMRS